MYRTIVKGRMHVAIVNGLLAMMMMLGFVGTAHAQETGTQIMLPLISTSQSSNAGGQGANIPHVDIDTPDVSAAFLDLGCVDHNFTYRIDGVSREWNGNWHIGRGGSGPIVKLLQWHLVYRYNKDLGNYGPLGDGVDGYYGEKTERAVRAVQQGHRRWGFKACGRHIDVDGIVGPQTWAIFL